MIMNPFRKLRFLHRAWGYRLRQERREIALLLKTLSPGDTAVDVGAHKGAYTWWMRKAVGTSGRVVAFEPQPELADYLHDVARAFRWNNVDIVNVALSATPGALKLYRPDGQVTPGATVLAGVHGMGEQSLDVPAESLDHYFRHRMARFTGQPVRLIKCDAEGHELDVLRGCRRIMAEDRPLLLLECVDALNDGGVEQVFGYLEQYGYDGFFFRGRELTSVRRLAAKERDERAPDFVYNFVFVHRQVSGRLRRAA